jgi:hypothetical protein
MPRGGARPGAGRPKGSGRKTPAKIPVPTVRRTVLKGMTPLEHMLAVMRDPKADPRSHGASRCALLSREAFSAFARQEGTGRAARADRA